MLNYLLRPIDSVKGRDTRTHTDKSNFKKPTSASSWCVHMPGFKSSLVETAMTLYLQNTTLLAIKKVVAKTIVKRI